mgnify:CR=1 FL=1
MFAYWGLRTRELIYGEIGNIIAEIVLAWEKAECYEEVDNHYKGTFTLIQNDNFLAYIVWYVAFL